VATQTTKFETKNGECFDTLQEAEEAEEADGIEAATYALATAEWALEAVKVAEAEAVKVAEAEAVKVAEWARLRKEAEDAVTQAKSMVDQLDITKGNLK
jgi:hypothetical protein